MSDPICNLCKQPCDVRQVDDPATNSAGAWTGHVGCTGVSWCCGVGYTIGAKENEQTEEYEA